MAQAPADSIRIPIQVYHTVLPHHPEQTPEQRQLDVDTSVFREQMSYLAEHKYNVISFARLVDALEGHRPLPERPVVLTFDDGWANQYNHAFPVLRDFGFTATFFVTTKPMGTDPLYMSWDQIHELQAAGMTIGAHSRTHPKLTAVSDSALRAEVEGSREEIQQHLGTTPRFFAYPYGAWDARTVAAVEAAGFQAARSLPYGPWIFSSMPFAIRSVLITDDMQAFERALGTP
jgi:peptidoglycan/xylan/chitin deacetylase (PgdA/CDA1 family)